MSILRYLNKHHGWYDGKRTPFTGAEEAAAVPMLVEAIEGGAAAEGAVTAGTAAEAGAGAGAYEAGLAGTSGNAALYGAGQTGATYAGAGAGASELATEQAAQEAARQAAIQNAGNSALANVPANQVGSYSGLQAELNAAANNPAYSNVVADASNSTISNATSSPYQPFEANYPTPEQLTNGPAPFESNYPTPEQISASNPGMGPNSTIPSAQMPGPFEGIKDYLPSQNQLMLGGGLYALNSMMNADKNKYGVPAAEKYNGPLSKMRYDPNTYQYNAPVNRQYTPNYSGYARMGYAEGGITQLTTGGSAPQIGTPAQNTTMDSSMGNNTMFPMSEMARSYYATPTQMPAGTNQTPSLPGYGPRLDTNTGQMTNNFAKGGIAGLLKGRGDGMSDSIHATIADKQPARLADGEFVVPADVVSHLGNGSTDAGARHLYKMMDKVRHARTGSKKQGKQIAAGGYLPIK